MKKNIVLLAICIPSFAFSWPNIALEQVAKSVCMGLGISQVSRFLTNMHRETLQNDKKQEVSYRYQHMRQTARDILEEIVQEDHSNTNIVIIDEPHTVRERIDDAEQNRNTCFVIIIDKDSGGPSVNYNYVRIPRGFMEKMTRYQQKAALKHEYAHLLYNHRYETEWAVQSTWMIAILLGMQQVCFQET